MKLLKTKLVTAMAIAVVSGSAMAGWTSAPIIGGGQVIVQDKSTTGLNASVDAIYTMAGAESLSDGDIVALRIIGGEWAFPATGPTAATGVAGNLIPLGNAAIPGASLPAGGDTIVYYRVDGTVGTIDPDDLITFTLTGGVETDLSDTALAEDVYYAISFYTALGATKHGVMDITTGLVATGIDLLTCGSATSTNDIITVDSQYEEFGVSGANEAGLMESPAWSIVTNNIAGAGGNTTNVGIPVGDLVLTATGTNTDTPSASLTYAQLEADLSGGNSALFTGPASAVVSRFDSATNFPLTTENNAVIDAEGILDLDPVVTTKGTNTPAHVITYSAAVTESALWDAQALVCTEVATFTATHNGSEFSSNNLGKANIIKITDMSGVLSADGAITRVVGFAEDGTMLADSTLAIDKLPNNGTIRIDGEALVESFPTTPFRIDFVVESDSVEVSNVKTTYSGALALRSTTIYRTADSVGAGQI